MADKIIMLACSAGMSTSLLVSKMQKAAKTQKIDVEIFATALSAADETLSEKQPDILLLGPQVTYALSDFKKKLSIPVAVINMQDYGMMNGSKVLSEALDMIK